MSVITVLSLKKIKQIKALPIAFDQIQPTGRQPFA